MPDPDLFDKRSVISDANPCQENFLKQLGSAKLITK